MQTGPNLKLPTNSFIRTDTIFVLSVCIVLHEELEMIQKKKKEK
jgi:hypothetical protein